MWQRGGWVAVLAIWTILVQGPSTGYVSSNVIDRPANTRDQSASIPNVRRDSVMLKRIRISEPPESSVEAFTDLNSVSVESSWDSKSHRVLSRHFPPSDKGESIERRHRTNPGNGRSLTNNPESTNREKRLSSDSNRARNITSGNISGGSLADGFGTFRTQIGSVSMEGRIPYQSARVGFEGGEIKDDSSPKSRKGTNWVRKMSSITTVSRIEGFKVTESRRINSANGPIAMENNHLTSPRVPGTYEENVGNDDQRRRDGAINRGNSDGSPRAEEISGASIKVVGQEEEMYRFEGSDNEIRRARIETLEKIGAPSKGEPTLSSSAPSGVGFRSGGSMKNDSKDDERLAREYGRSNETRVTPEMGGVDEEVSRSESISRSKAMREARQTGEERVEGQKFTRDAESAGEFDESMNGISYEKSIEVANESISWQHLANESLGRGDRTDRVNPVRVVIPSSEDKEPESANLSLGVAEDGDTDAGVVGEAGAGDPNRMEWNYANSQLRNGTSEKKFSKLLSQAETSTARAKNLNSTEGKIGPMSGIDGLEYSDTPNTPPEEIATNRKRISYRNKMSGISETIPRTMTVGAEFSSESTPGQTLFPRTPVTKARSESQTMRRVAGVNNGKSSVHSGGFVGAFFSSVIEDAKAPDLRWSSPSRGAKQTENPTIEDRSAIQTNRNEDLSKRVDARNAQVGTVRWQPSESNVLDDESTSKEQEPRGFDERLSQQNDARTKSGIEQLDRVAKVESLRSEGLENCCVGSEYREMAPAIAKVKEISTNGESYPTTRVGAKAKESSNEACSPTANRSDACSKKTTVVKKSQAEIDERREMTSDTPLDADRSRMFADASIWRKNPSEVDAARIRIADVREELSNNSSSRSPDPEEPPGIKMLVSQTSMTAETERINFHAKSLLGTRYVSEFGKNPLSLTNARRNRVDETTGITAKLRYTNGSKDAVGSYSATTDKNNPRNESGDILESVKLSGSISSNLYQTNNRFMEGRGKVTSTVAYFPSGETRDDGTISEIVSKPPQPTARKLITSPFLDPYILSKTKRHMGSLDPETSSISVDVQRAPTDAYSSVSFSSEPLTTSFYVEPTSTPESNIEPDTAFGYHSAIRTTDTVSASRTPDSIDAISLQRKRYELYSSTAKESTTTEASHPMVSDILGALGYHRARSNLSLDSEDSSRLSAASNQWPVKHSAVVEGDLVLGGLMMVHEREDSVTCGPVMPQGGVQALEAMLYTLDRLNNEQIVPGVKIGAHILDDCDKDTYGLEMAVDFIKGSISNIDGAEYHCNKTAIRKVISGVVGAASSVTSIQVANLLRLFRIPQVSFFSTSPELSNKQRFEYFSRTIPSDHYQVKAMVDIVRKMNWSYVSIIYEESNYGIKAFEELEELLAKYDICIAIKEKLVKDSGVAEETAYDNIVQKLLTKPRARGCIIFGSDQEVAGVMRAVSRCNATGAFSWIGSDGWSARGLVSNGNEPEVEGTLSVQPQANPVQGFEEYFLNLTVENNRRNPWFVEFWEDHFQCRYPNASRTPYNQKYTKPCTTKERLTKQTTAFEDQLQFVSDAVMAFAYAFRDMHRELCNGKPGLCDAMKPTKGTELLKYLRKVDFKGLSGDKFKFDKNGDGPARYNIIHFKQVSPKNYKWIRVGEYLEGELRLNMSEIQFRLENPSPPESVCSLPCEVGQAKKYVEGESCCWHCFECTQYQVRHPTDETQCFPCPQGTVPDATHSNCRAIPEEFLRPESGWAIGAMSFSATGILMTLFVVGVFLRHNDTPIVRASGRELSYVLLTGILLCYLVTFALVLRPNDLVCGIQRFGAGFCFTVVYAALLTKTNRIARIFNAGKHSAKRPSFISPRSQLIICSGLVGVQILINGVWMVIDPAKAMYHYPTREDNLLVCSSYIDASYMIVFSYPIILIVVCTIYAILTRKIPEAFNESKHIGFTMYTTCVIWLAFVPLYFGTGSNVALRITSMSVTISLSASVTITCLFGPKLYIILIRPERNVRQSMMPRFNTTKSSAVTGTNASSMMATVALTAATCNQNTAVQRHVKATIDCSTQSEHYEMELIDGRANGKAAPPRIERSTQTHNQWFDAEESKLTLAPANIIATPISKDPGNREKFTKDPLHSQNGTNSVKIGNGPIAHKDIEL